MKRGARASREPGKSRLARGAGARLARGAARRENFVLDCRARIPWTRLPNRGWYAVFDDLPSPFGEAHRLFVASGIRELRRGLARLLKRGAIANPARVFVETAGAKSKLSDLEYERRVADVFLGIAAIQQRGDRQTLLAIRAALGRKGGRRGPKRQRDAVRWKVETLRQLAGGQPLKASVAHPRRTPQSASAEIGRFCREFYEYCWWLDAHSPDSWQRDAAGMLGEKFGFEFPRDALAAREAYLRGKRSVERAAGEDQARG